MEKVLKAILFVLHEGTWRGINQPDANWNSVYQYYRRWCREGVWAAVWEQVAPPNLVRSTWIPLSLKSSAAG